MLIVVDKTAGLLFKADKIFIDHCTLIHRSQVDNCPVIPKYLQSRIGDDVVLKITSVGFSTKAMAFKVDLYNSALRTMCANKVPHITIATFNGGKPVDSNKIVEWTKLYEPIYITAKIDKR